MAVLEDCGENSMAQGRMRFYLVAVRMQKERKKGSRSPILFKVTPITVKGPVTS